MEEGQLEARRKTLWILHGAIADLLLERIRCGEAGSSELDVAIKFLKNNGITQEYQPQASAAMRALGEACNLPFQLPHQSTQENDHEN